jgi:hypothetical protein
MRFVIGFAAHLRVYQPLAAFGERERRHWQAYIDSGAVASRPLLMAREHSAGVAATIQVSRQLDLASHGEHAYVRHLDGLTYVCPWHLQVRAWESLAEFCARLPDELVDAFVPSALAEAAETEHDSWVSTHPDTQVAILTSTWEVPLSWFVLFEGEERRLVLGERRASGAPPHTGLDRALVYLTAMSRARRRSAYARQVVRRVFDEGPALAALDELGRWLEEFHPHSLVELDYGGLVHLLDDEALAEDTSVADVAAALHRLSEGDGAAAAEIYQSLLGRWRAIAALEHAN